MRVRLEKVNNCFKTCLDPDPQLKPDYRSYPDTNLQFQKISSAGLGKEHTHLSFAKYFSKWIPEYTQQAAASRARKQGSMEARRQEGKEARRQGGKGTARSSSSCKQQQQQGGGTSQPELKGVKGLLLQYCTTVVPALPVVPPAPGPAALSRGTGTSNSKLYQ
jgi:hypothetical protein